MRADVKLGVVISLVVVFVAGGYYLYRDRRDTPIPMNGGSISSAEPTKPVKAPKSVTTTSVSKRPTATGEQRSAKRGARRLSPGGAEQGPPTKKRPASRGAPSGRAGKKGSSPQKSQATPTGSDRPEGRSQRNLAKGSKDAGAAHVTKGGRERDTVPSGGLENAKRKHVPSKTSTATAAERQRRSPGRRRSHAGPRRSLVGGSGVAEREVMAAADSKPVPSKAVGEPKVDASSAAVDTHRVQSGDTLSSLAQVYYGDAKYAQLLIDGNPGLGDPNRLRVGSLVKIPPLPSELAVRSAIKPVVKAASAAQETGKRRVYTVKPGDTFYGVARDVLGDASRWKELFALNRELVQGDPTRLQIDQVIVLPQS